MDNIQLIRVGKCFHTLTKNLAERGFSYANESQLCKINPKFGLALITVESIISNPTPLNVTYKI